MSSLADGRPPADGASRRGPWLRVALASVAVFSITFAFRWLTLSEFTNDHFDHVAVAQQLLLGEWPVRDFVDEGFPLAYIVSAAAWRLVGEPFVSEALVVATGFAIAAALSFRVACRLSGSMAIAAGAIALQVALLPRSYSYPKLLVHAVAIAVACWALERLTTRRLAALGAATAFGYYYRHDHAVYLAFAISVLISAALWREGTARVLRTLATYALLTLLFVLPHLIYVQWAIGLPTYLAISREYVRAEASGGQYVVPRLSLDRRDLVREPPMVTIHVRWVAGTPPAERQQVERQFALVDGVPSDLTTWRYHAADPGLVSERALRANPRIEDVDGLEELAAASAWRARLTAMRPGDGWHVGENSLALLYWTWWLAPLAAGIVLAHRTVSGANAGTLELPLVAMLIALAWCAALGFLRHPLPVRVPDPVLSQSVLGAWTFAILWRAPSSRGRRVFTRLAILVVASAIAAAAVVDAQTIPRIRESKLLAGPGPLAVRWRDVLAGLRDERPGPVPSNPSKLLLPFIEYVRRCTTADDRLLYVGYSPEVFVVARRGFAGDHRKLLPPFHSAPWEQALTMNRLTQQHVPFAVVPSAQRAAFEQTYPPIARFVADRYVPFASIDAGDGKRLEILRERSWRSAACGDSGIDRFSSIGRVD